MSMELRTMDKNKDKESLLAMQPSDSDDVVEEFKLPPPRTRTRTKSRKTLGDVRRVTSSYSFFSCRCCFILLMSTVVVGAALVLAYFMLLMQQQINTLTVQVDKLNSKKDNTAAFKTMRNHMESSKKRTSKHEQTINALTVQVRLLNETVKGLSERVKKTSSQNQYGQKIDKLTNDIDSIQTGMATTGSQISNLKSQVQQHGEKVNGIPTLQNLVGEHTKKIDSVFIELKAVKLEIAKATTENKTDLAKVQAVSWQTEEIEKTKLMILSVNKTQNGAIMRLGKQIYENRIQKENDMEIMRKKLRSVNETAISELDSVSFLLKKLKNSTEKDQHLMEKEIKRCTTSINSTRLAVQQLSRQVDSNSVLLQKNVKLAANVESCQVGLNKTQLDVLDLKKMVTDHHTMINKHQVMIDQHHNMIAEHHDKMYRNISEVKDSSSSVNSTGSDETPAPSVQPTVVVLPTNCSSCGPYEECKREGNHSHCVCKDGFVKVGKSCERNSSKVAVASTRKPVIVTVISVNSTMPLKLYNTSSATTAPTLHNNTASVKQTHLNVTNTPGSVANTTHVHLYLNSSDTSANSSVSIGTTPASITKPLATVVTKGTADAQNDDVAGSSQVLPTTESELMTPEMPDENGRYPDPNDKGQS